MGCKVPKAMDYIFFFLSAYNTFFKKLFTYLAAPGLSFGTSLQHARSLVAALEHLVAACET